MVSQAISIGIQLTSTVVLARLLSPDDYGVMAMVMAVTGFAGLFRDLGLSSAAIQKKNLTDAQQNNLFWLNVAMGALLTVFVAAGSPLVAWFYGKPELTAVTLALSASFLIGSFGTQHGARLVREMQFARQASAKIGGAIVRPLPTPPHMTRPPFPSAAPGSKFLSDTNPLIPFYTQIATTSATTSKKVIIVDYKYGPP